MRMQDKANRDSQKKSSGGISDQHVQQLQDERKAVQKRTFTRWMNVFLQRRDPPIEVHDLFTDIQDGRILMALLEELSGCELLYRFRSSPHRIFRLNNISKALAFLDDRHVKLLGIDASAIADGIPSVVLNLVWNMILHFQVKEVTGSLQKHLSSSLSSLSMSSYPSSSNLSPQPSDIGSYSCNTMPSKGRKAAREPKYHGKAIKTLLQWVQRCTSKFGVEMHDFGRSWRSGLAFLAMIKSINPALVDLKESLPREPRENIQLAFMIAHHSLDIPPLLEPEDVLCTSPDEQSIITYVSMFLRHCSGTDKDHTTNIDDPEIPNFGSLESVGFEETLSEDPEAQALLQGLQKSSEQLLWISWARRSSGRPCATSLPTSEATSPRVKKQSRCRSILQHPSPLDAGVVGQEIRSWMEKASVDQGYSQRRVDESFSLSSEEGLHSLLALDSDEEDAYSYILDLNKEVFQPYNQLITQVPMVEEEKKEEMFLNGQKTEYSKHLEVCETLNGTRYKHQGGSLAQNVESEIRAQSAIHSMFDWDKNQSSSREMANSMALVSMKPGKDSSDNGEESEDERVVRGQSNDDSDCCEEEQRKEKTENALLVTRGCDKRAVLVDETKNPKLFVVASWKTEFEEESVRGLFENGGQASEKRVVDKEEAEVNEKVSTDEAVHKVRDAGACSINTKEENDGKAPKIEDEDKVDYSDAVTNSVDFEEVRTVEEKDKLKKHKLTDKVATRIDHPGKIQVKNDTNGAVNVRSGESWTPACSERSQSFREGGFILQSSAASCDITPLELEMLLVLWILLYSCFILAQMNF